MSQSISVGARARPQAVLFGQFQDPAGGGAGLDPRSKAVAQQLRVYDALKSAFARKESTGEPGNLVEAFPSGRSASERVLVIGLGKPERFDVGSLRNAAGVILKRLVQAKVGSTQIELASLLKHIKADVAAGGNAFGEGLGLADWVCDEFRGKATPTPQHPRMSFGGGGKDFENGLLRGIQLAAATNFARTLSQTPPNVATPAWMADQAQRLARRTGLSCKVFRGDELRREKFEGLINVGKASQNKPCLIRLEYKPRGGAKSSKPAVLIGKTMCYDTGGLSLKINNGMVGMKRDKDGGCAVLGAMQAIATLIKPKRRVVALLAAAENSISHEAFRPDDVIRYRNGVTVEVTNTDAEGRLVLADALCWACEKENPAYVIDIATLTGGVVVALGATYCGMFCEDDRLRGKVQAAADAAGERVWRLPMHDEYREMMKSPIADIVNSNPNRKASPIQGAAFLSYFVEDKIPWCHLDIAGVHAVESNTGPFIAGPTGWGVRTFANLLDAE